MNKNNLKINLHSKLGEVFGDQWFKEFQEELIKAFGKERVQTSENFPTGWYADGTCFISPNAHDLDVFKWQCAENAPKSTGIQITSESYKEPPYFGDMKSWTGTGADTRLSASLGARVLADHVKNTVDGHSENGAISAHPEKTSKKQPTAYARAQLCAQEGITR